MKFTGIKHIDNQDLANPRKGVMVLRACVMCNHVSGGFDDHPRAVPDNAFPIARGVA